MKTLIIGHSINNLADMILTHMKRVWPVGDEIYTPTNRHLDVTDQKSIDLYIETNGPFNNIVYAAGYNELRWIKDHTLQTLTHAYQVNVLGLVAVIAAHERFYPDHMGRLVAIVSDSSRTPMRGSIAYGSSKTAMVGALKNIARELAPSWVVVGVSPGIIEHTPMTRYIDATVPAFRGWTPEQAKEYEKSMIPINRRVYKSEVAETVMFALSGPQALTGTIIEITGGK